MVAVDEVVGLEMLEDETLSLHVRAPGGTVYIVLTQDDWWRVHLLTGAMFGRVAGVEVYDMDDGATWFRVEELSNTLPPADSAFARKTARVPCRYTTT